MPRFSLIFVLIIFTSCSLDNKTGIWKDASNIIVENNQAQSLEDSNEKLYEDLFTEKKIFNEEKNSLNASKLKIDSPINVVNWFEQYGIPTNNISNFSYSGDSLLVSSSRRLSKFSSQKNNSNRNIVFYQNNLISYDHRGTIFIYSIDLKKKIFEYNFYKKKFKKFQKEIFLIIYEDVLYAADNLGYIYAINLKNQSIIWAKNYGIPFRSNLKATNKQIFLANQDNVIYSISTTTGKKKWQFATSPTFLKSNFKNNFALDIINNNLFFLNTSGELYSISYLNQKINWVINFKKRSASNDTNLFISKPIILKNDSLIITTNKSISSYNISTATRNWIFYVDSILKPIATLNNIYIITKNDFLICLNNETGSVIWSQNIYKNLNNAKLVKKIGKFNNFKIINKIINLYSKNGYLLSFNFTTGKRNNIIRVSKNGINSDVFILNNSIFLLNKKNKLFKYN